MKTTVGVCVWGAVLGMALVAAGCSKKSEGDSGAGGAADAPSATAATPTTTTPVATATVTVPHVANDADAAAVRSCCAALRTASGSAKASDKPKFDAAAAACEGIAVSVKNGASTRSSAMGSIRAALHGQTLPAGCN